MNIPLIGGQKDRKARQEQEAKEKFQEEMFTKLADWELANNCMIRAELSFTTLQISSVLTVKKMDDNTRKLYEGIKIKKEKDKNAIPQ